MKNERVSYHYEHLIHKQEYNNVKFNFFLSFLGMTYNIFSKHNLKTKSSNKDLPFIQFTNIITRFFFHL